MLQVEQHLGYFSYCILFYLSLSRFGVPDAKNQQVQVTKVPGTMYHSLQSTSRLPGYRCVSKVSE